MYDANPQVSLFHDVQLGSSVFLGEVRLNCSAIELRQQEPLSAWYYLGPREEFSRKSNSPELGALRLNLHFTSDTVFPSATYEQLRQLITSSWQVQPITCSAAYIISQLVCSVSLLRYTDTGRDKWSLVFVSIWLFLCLANAFCSKKTFSSFRFHNNYDK